MRKILIVLLCCALAFSLIACGDSEPPQNNGDEVVNGEVSENNGNENANGEEPETNGNESTNGGVIEDNGDEEPAENATENNENEGAAIEVDENAQAVEITLASWFVDFLAEFVGMTPYEIFEGYEFDSAGINQAGAFVAVIPRAEYDQLMIDLRNNLTDTLGELAGDPFTPYVRNIIVDNNFRNVIVEVDRETYENALFEFAHIIIGMTVIMYQMFDGQDGHLTIEFRDVVGGELLTTHNFP